MDFSGVLEYLSCGLMAVGVLAFLVSMVVQVIKEMPGLAKVQTNAVTLGVSLVFCPVAVVVACQYFKIALRWYYMFASVVGAFLVYLVSTGGWERVKKMWERTKYKDGGKKRQ